MATEKTALDHLLDAMTHLVSMNDSSLEQLQEIVDYIKENADGLEEIEISQIIGLEDALASKVAIASVVDNLISTLTTAPLSANQGRVLNEKIQTISTAIETMKSVISSDDTSLDELQEIVNFIKQNKEDLANLDLSNIAETSTLKHFTKEMLEKLEGIEEGATNYELPETLPIEKIEGLDDYLDSLSSDIENKSSTPLNISSMLKGTVSLSNTIKQIGFKTQLYKGNGTSKDIVTGVNMKDNWADYSNLSLWSAGRYNTDDEVYILDSSNRVLRCICLRDDVTSDPNTLLDFTDATFIDWKIESKTFGGRIWIKNRDVNYGAPQTEHIIVDTIRGIGKYIGSDGTDAQWSVSTAITAFNSNGFGIGTLSRVNGDTNNIVSWTDQTTFCESGLTNQNKPYIRETNAVTGYVQIKYKGSGTAGHEIPHGMGRKLGFTSTKNLGSSYSWVCQNEFDGSGHYLLLNNNVGIQTSANLENTVTNTILSLGSSVNINESGSLHILYGYANSYIDENNILQGNYEIGTYVGTGASVNKITTKAKPAYVMIKRLDSTGDWIMEGVASSGGNNRLRANLSNAEDATTYDGWYFNEDGIDVRQGSQVNASSGQYLYLVVYGNDSGSGASKYTQATETTQLQINDAILSISNGYSSTNAVDNKISTFDGTVLPTNGWEE